MADGSFFTLSKRKGLPHLSGSNPQGAPARRRAIGGTPTGPSSAFVPTGRITILSARFTDAPPADVNARKGLFHQPARPGEALLQVGSHAFMTAAREACRELRCMVEAI